MRVIGTQLTATDVAGTLNINGAHLIISNDGSKTIYLLIEQFQDMNTPLVPADSFPLASGEVLQMDSVMAFRTVHYVCAAGETCLFRYLSWR